MAPQENKIDKCAIIGIDIENTGHTDDDIIFAIGISWGFVGCDKVLKMQMIMFLREPGTVEEWRQFWLDNGFEMRCFEEFWSKNIDVLNGLMEKATIFETDSKYSGGYDSGHLHKHHFVEATAVLAEHFNNALINIEDLYKSTSIVLDTLCFDSAWLNHLLIFHGHRSLSFTRMGKYRGWNYEIDSIIAGLARINPITGNWKRLAAFKAEQILTRLPHLGDTCNSHNPGDDAENILVTFLRALDYVDNMEMIFNEIMEAHARVAELTKIVKDQEKRLRRAEQILREHSLLSTEPLNID